MKAFALLLPLLGLVTAQMHNTNTNMNRGRIGNPNDPFFNEFGKRTSSRTAAPWQARPNQGMGGGGGGHMAGMGGGGGGQMGGGGGYGGQMAGMGGGGGGHMAGMGGQMAGFGYGHSSTNPPHHAAAPMGNPQVVNNNPHANADPNAQGGNSGGLAGFADADYFHAQVEANANGMPVGAAGPVGTGQNSGERAHGGGGGGGGGGNDAFPIGPGLIAGGGVDHNEMQKRNEANEVFAEAASASTVVGVVVAVLIVIGIFALVAVFLVRQRRNSRVVIGSV